MTAETLDGFRATEIGDLPESWSVVELGELFEVQQGKALSQATRFGPSPRRFLRTANVRWGRFDLTKLDQMNFSDEEAERLSLRPGDLLVCEGGEIGRAALWKQPVPGYSFQNHLHRLRARSAEVDPEFVMYWLQAAFLHLRVYGGIGNRTTIPNLSSSRLKQLAVPQPAPAEQRAIAGLVSKLQSAVEVQDRIVVTLKELKAATMTKLFREGLRGEPLKQTEIGEIPESWEATRFGDFATLQRGFDLPLQKRTPGPFPVVGSNGIVGMHHEATVNGPGVVTGRSGTIGLSFYSPSDFWPLNTSLFVADFHGNDPLFAHYYFQQFDFERYAAGVSVPTLNRNLVHEATVAVPTLDDQRRIASALSSLDASLTTAEKTSSFLAQLFTSMLCRLMAGQLRLTVSTE